MKCINCGTDNNLKDRTANQGRCIKCQHPFAFEPTAMSNIKITDPMFAKAIADLSANNTLFFTSKQLLYFLDNRLKSKPFSRFAWWFIYVFLNLATLTFNIGLLIVNLLFIWIAFSNMNSSKIGNKNRQANARALLIQGVIIIVGGILISIATNSFIIFVIAVIMGIASTYLGTRQLGKIGLVTQELLISQSQFQEWLDKWQQVNGVTPKILLSPREELTPATINPDVIAYSFDRLIVCDSSIIAQLLIANNFHFENNCAILSITGYPQSIFDTTMEMLRRNPDLQVYALHNCSPSGINLVNHLRSSEHWFLNSNVTIIDVGILPRQIIATKRGMFIQSTPESAQAAKQLDVDIRQSLTTEELAWLDSGKFVELESFTPQRLIKVLQRGIAGSRDLGTDDSNLIIIGDSGIDIYAVESFG